MAERRLPRGLLDPESQAIAEAYEAIPSVRRQTRGLLSLDPQEDQSMGQTAFEMLASFIPGVGQLLAGRDIERARRANDPAAAAMAATEFLPFGRLAGMMRRPGPIMSELDVYHGSPHRFEEFDASKIGTGEGAQAYGHGIYLAENPKVAMDYQKLEPTVPPPPRRTFKGVELEPGSPEYHAARIVDEVGLNKGRKQVRSWIESADPRMTREVDGWRRTLQVLNDADSKKDFKSLKNQGNLYTADLPDEMVDRMLRFEMPLNEMPDDVAKLINPIREQLAKQPNPSLFANAKTVGDIIQYSNAVNLKPHEQLQQAGIPGIKYLDAGSRGQGGSGTRNFVVFPGEEKKVKILKRE